MIYKTHNTDETIELAAKLANEYPVPHTFCLKGDLGAGKTAFTRGLAKGYGYDGRVSSPTFTIMNIYECVNTERHHYDLYRIADEDELYEIGFEAQEDNCITVVEWYDDYVHLFPKEGTTFVNIMRVDSNDDYRQIEVSE